MALIRVAGGAEIDVASRADVADIVASSMRAAGVPAHPTEPERWQKKSQTGVALATGQTFLKLGRPISGRQHNIVALAVVGADDHTQYAGSNVSFYIGDAGAIPVNGLAPLGDLFLPGGQGGAAVTVPASASFSSKACVCMYPDDCYVAVLGVAAGTQLSAVMWYWDSPISDVAGYV